MALCNDCGGHIIEVSVRESRPDDVAIEMRRSGVIGHIVHRVRCKALPAVEGSSAR